MTTRDRIDRRWLLAGLTALALLLSACGSGDDGEDAAEEGTDGGGGGDVGTIVVGSTNFTEQELVAEMYALALEDAGLSVERRFQLGSREVVLPAVQSGDLDVYPEYVGTALEFLNGGAGEATSDTEESLELLREEFGEDITVLDPAEAQDKNTLVVTGETADEYGLETTSDLAEVAGDLTLGGPPECPQRPLCLPGYQETYGFEFGEFRSLDAGGPLTVSALENGDVDVALMFTTQGIIGANDWVALEDDQGLQPAENVIPVVRTEVATDEVVAALDTVSAALTTEALISLNERVDVDGEAPADVAASFLEEEGVLGG